jgi:hypothetical protein
MRKLNTYVHVGDRRYGPDDTISDEVAAQITNPDVWAEREDPAPAVQKPPEGGGQPPIDPDPNRPAGNATREAWATYATGRKVEVTGQMGRDEIKAAVEKLDAQQAGQQGK